MRPLKIKASSYPVSASNFQGLQEMTDTEIEQYYSATLLKDFSDNTNGTGTGELNVTTDGSGAGTTIGSITDTKRNDAIGTHPTDGATSNVNVYTVKQVNAAASESVTNRPLGYESSGTIGIHEFTDSEVDSDILDKVLGDLVAQGAYVTGQYKIGASAPSGGTWTSRYTIIDTQVDETESTKYIWQKTAATTAAVSNYKPCRLDGTSVIEMSASEMEQIVPNMRNRITDSTIGTYALQTGAPASGTWVQQGEEFSDTRQEVGSQTYEGNYVGNYTGGYTGNKTYAGNYAGNYTGAYTGNYVGTSAYSGSYSGDYSGSYAADYSGYAGTAYAGTYAGTYTGSYVGAKTYTGYYSGAYAGTYAGNYVGTSAYSGTYTGTYTGYYAGDTVLASEETVGTVKLWIKTAA